MAILIPPPPVNAEQGDRVWTDWYIRLANTLSSTAGIAWALVDKSGSSIADIATRTHALLTGILGDGEYHISGAQATAVANMTTSGHQGLTSINGAGNYHVTSAEATTLTNLNTSSVFPLRSGAADPTTTDVTASKCVVWKNTTANEVRLWVNDGGVMKKSVALT